MRLRMLPSGDEIGLGVFMFLIILTISGYLAATVNRTINATEQTLGDAQRHASELDAVRVPIEMLVIDHAERPISN